MSDRIADPEPAPGLFDGYPVDLSGSALVATVPGGRIRITSGGGITVEPATAPSVEQIANRVTDWMDDQRTTWALAEEIRALYGTPGDTGEDHEDFLIGFGALEAERDDLSAEVTRLKVALEEQQIRLKALRKAEGYTNPRGLLAAFSSDPEQRRGRALIEAADWVVGDAARAAREVETSEEAGA